MTGKSIHSSAFKLLVAWGLVLLFISPADATEITLSEVKLTPSDAAQGDVFGVHVAIDGDTIVIGASSDDDLASNAGAAYVFERGPSGWFESIQLFASDGTAVDLFGDALDISGNTIAVSAIAEDGATVDTGAVYVFDRGISGWIEEAKLTADDLAPVSNLGISIAIDGDVIVAGACGDNPLGAKSGSAVVFARSASVWSRETKLTASDGNSGDQFGCELALHGDLAVVGARLADGVVSGAGAAYVFRRNGGSWTEEEKLVAPDGVSGDEFGSSLAIDGERILVGSRNDNGHGSAYIFRDIDGEWLLEERVEAAAPSSDALFGFQKAAFIADGLAVVGAPFRADLGPRTGSVHLFTRDEAGWSEKEFLTPSDPSAFAKFGAAVDLSSTTLVVGSSEKNNFRGAVYVYELDLDSDGDGVSDENDACSGTEIPELSVPSRRLGVNRWALTDADNQFDTTPPPSQDPPAEPGYTLDDTAGCSCEQIIIELDLGVGHSRFGCSTGAMETWLDLFR